MSWFISDLRTINFICSFVVFNSVNIVHRVTLTIWLLYKYVNKLTYLQKT